MIPNARPSILKRPLRPPSQTNAENRETEHEKHLAYWSLKSEQARRTEDRLLRSIYPDKESKLRDQAEMREAMDRQLGEIQQRRAAEAREKADSWQPAAAAQDRPWAHRTDSSIQRHIHELRRQMERETAEENRRLMQLRAEERRREEEAVREQTRRAVQSEDTWWNLGAASGRWIPPERRPRATRGAAVAQSTCSLPPYAWVAADRGGAPAPPTPTAPPAQRTYPWTWHG
mmetsp:Transcript_9944/g.23742  ORF Transcript_9944/g.23742 Transcript_9944/m.23742 type:complete len:231 (-) Transcript_9944:218-910(-)